MVRGGVNASMATNRAELLVELICQHNQDQDAGHMFDLLVPRMHGQLYSLYSVLSDSKVLEQCVFKTPLIDGDQIKISISLNKAMVSKCVKYLDENGPVVKFLRELKYHVELGKIPGGMALTLKPAV